MKWVTRARPRIDRIACPWLIRRFIDREPEFLFVPADQVAEVARTTGAMPFDIPGAELGHHGELCSFDAFLKKFALQDPSLARLATIVRSADTGRLDLRPEGAGLLSISLGLSINFPDDHEMLSHGLIVYDALFSWIRLASSAQNAWPSPLT
jgi:hypothetical protein